jgi:hypothetical protein
MCGGILANDHIWGGLYTAAVVDPSHPMSEQHEPWWVRLPEATAALITTGSLFAAFLVCLWLLALSLIQATSIPPS